MAGRRSEGEKGARPPVLLQGLTTTHLEYFFAQWGAIFFVLAVKHDGSCMWCLGHIFTHIVDSGHLFWYFYLRQGIGRSDITAQMKRYSGNFYAPGIEMV